MNLLTTAINSLQRLAVTTAVSNAYYQAFGPPELKKGSQHTLENLETLFKVAGVGLIATCVAELVVSSLNADKTSIGCAATFRLNDEPEKDVIIP